MNNIKQTNIIFEKIPMFIHKHLSDEKKWSVSIPDNWENYEPTTRDKMNLEDLGFHFRILCNNAFNDYAFDTKKEAVEAARVIKKENKKFKIVYE